MSALVEWGVLFLLMVLLWAFMIRPASRQRREMQQFQAGLRPGQAVVTGSGIFGRIVDVADRVRLEIAPGVVIEVARTAVVRNVDGETTVVHDGDSTIANEGNS